MPMMVQKLLANFPECRERMADLRSAILISPIYWSSIGPLDSTWVHSIWTQLLIVTQKNDKAELNLSIISENDHLRWSKLPVEGVDFEWCLNEIEH